MGYYLPDFYINHLGIWLEIKPSDLTILERKKLDTLAIKLSQNNSGQSCAALIGNPYATDDDIDYYWLEIQCHICETRSDCYDENCMECGPYDCSFLEQGLRLERTHNALVQCRCCGIIRPESIEYHYPGHIFSDGVCSYGAFCCDKEVNNGFLSNKLKRAYLNARQARFEHGETPEV